jgi:hypothetical protein
MSEQAARIPSSSGPSADRMKEARVQLENSVIQLTRVATNGRQSTATSPTGPAKKK